MRRQYLVMEEGEPVGWDGAATVFADKPIRAAGAFAEAEFNDPSDWEYNDERFVLVKDVETGEIWRFCVQGKITMDFDVALDKSFNQQEASHALV